MRRFRISSAPTLASKRQRPCLRMIGIGSGHSSAPTTQDGLVVAVRLQLVCGIIGGNEARPRAPIGDGIAGMDQLRTARPEDSVKFADVIAAVRGNQRIDCRCRRRETLLHRGCRRGRYGDRGDRRKTHRDRAEPQSDQEPVGRISRHRFLDRHRITLSAAAAMEAWHRWCAMEARHRRCGMKTWHRRGQCGRHAA